MKLPIPVLTKTIQQAVSGERAWQTVVDICQYHRIQASPGYRAAAHYVCDRLKEAGVKAQIHSYAADCQSVFWTGSLSCEWHVHSARLDLLVTGEAPQRLADFQACPISLIQRSAPFDGVAEVVVLERGERPEDYAGRDVAGKVPILDY